MTGATPDPGAELDVLRGALRPYRRTVAIGAGLAVVHQACEALVVVLIGVVIDEAVTTGDGEQLAWWLGALAGVFVALALAGLVGYYLLDRVEQCVAHDLRVRIGERVLDLRGGADGNGPGRRPGEILSLAAGDAERAGSFGGVLAGAISAGVVLVGGGLYLVSASWLLGLIALAGLPVVVIVAQRAAGPLRERSEAEQAAAADATAVAVDLVAGLRVLKGVGAEPVAADRYRGVSRAARDARIVAAAWNGRADGLTAAVSGLFVVVLAWAGGRLALEGTISVGELVAAVGLAVFLVDPLDRLARYPADRTVAHVSAQRIARLLSAPPAVADGLAEPPGTPQPLTLRQVRTDVLQGLDLLVEPGEMLGVVADPRSAADLLALLARRYDPPGGHIEYGSHPLAAYRLAALRAAVRVDDHDAMLFTGTLADAIKPPVPGQSIDPAVLAACGLEELVSALPEGLGATIGERGRALSGGQRQRVALARAVAGDPAVLVLHDPTTAVDPVTEHRIAEGLAKLRSGRTTVVITASAALLARCRRVVVLRAGCVAAEGTHADLIGVDRDYRAAVLR